MKISKLPILAFALPLLTGCDLRYRPESLKKNKLMLLKNEVRQAHKMGSLPDSTTAQSGQYQEQPQQQQRIEPKTWRDQLPNGGYIEYSLHEDGSLTTTSEMPCIMCHGSGLCPACNGAGGVWGRAYGGMYYPCNMCIQTGICNSCKGVGTVTTVSRNDANGNGSLYSSNGYSAQSSPGGVIVTDPNGRSTVHPSGGRSYSESSSRGSSNNDYIEDIEYAPDYTGDAMNVWCEKCQKWAPRHSHIRKRVR